MATAFGGTTGRATAFGFGTEGAALAAMAAALVAAAATFAMANCDGSGRFG